MKFEQMINDLMKEYTTENCYKFWIVINQKFPTVWDRSSSSTNKYHKRKDGSVQSIAEHTYEMLYSASKLIRMYNIQKNTIECNTLFLSIVFHDFFKYGKDDPLNRQHTDRKHDQISADIILKNKETFLKILDKENFYILEESVRFHSGRWSTDLNKKNEKEKDEFLSGVHPISSFVHMLDMMSCNDLIKI